MSRHCHHQQGQQYHQGDSVVEKNVDQGDEDENGTLRPGATEHQNQTVGRCNNLEGDSDEHEVVVIDSDDEDVPQSVNKVTSEPQRNQAIPDVCGDGASETVIEEDDSSESAFEDDNESDVVDLFEDDEDIMFQKVKSQDRMTCNRCYPITHFRKKSLYIIHRLRHYAETHFICPICKKGFVKLIHCVNHELSVHKAETKLTDPRFSTALTVILSDKSVETNNQTNTNETQETEDDDLYRDYAVVSSALYPYKGPKLSNLRDSYQMQYKYGRPRESKINNIAKLANLWRNQAAEFERRELAYEAQRRKRAESKSVVSAVSVSNTSTPTKSDKDGSDSDSSCEKELTAKKKKKYKKKVRRRSNSPERSYCCKICNFKCDSNDKFQDHKTTSHPNLTEAEVLQYFVLPTIGTYSPVRKKKTGIGTFLSNTVEREGSGYSSSSSVANSSFSTPPVSIILHDINSKVGFANALELLRN